MTRCATIPRRDLWTGTGRLLLGILLILIASPAEALRTEKREKVRSQIREVKAWQMTRELGLSEEQARSFMPAHEGFETRKSELDIKREAIEARLDSLLAGGGSPRSEREILESLEHLKRVDLEMKVNKREFERKLARFLRPEQQARYELFEKKFDAELRRMIRDVRIEKPAGDPVRRDSTKKTEKTTEKKDRNPTTKKSKSDKKDSSGKRSSRGG